MYFLLNCLQLKITLMPKWHISGVGEYRYRSLPGLNTAGPEQVLREGDNGSVERSQGEGDGEGPIPDGHAC